VRRIQGLPVAALCAVLFAPGSGAATEDAAAQQILARLKAARPDLDYTPPRPSTMAGLYEVKVVGGPTLYVSADGQQFVAGDLYSVGESGFFNVAERERKVERRELLAAVDPKDMIIFSPPKPKATVTVFTDVDCGYCRKLHKEMPELNRLGIAVHYLAFPRAGLDSPSYRRIATAWCSDDPKEALTRMKNGESIPENVCADNPVAAQMHLGESIGVSGTPAMVLEDGTLVPGYRPAQQLAHELGID